MPEPILTPYEVKQVTSFEVEQKKKDISFRLSWAQAILFGCYEVTISFILVIVSISYYKKPESGAVSSCGQLFPDWQSVAVIITFYTLVYLSMVVANIYFIRQTTQEVTTNVSIWIILTHPAGRLMLGLLAFFITCAFSVPDDKAETTSLQFVNRIALYLTKTCMVVDSGFVIFFFVAVIKKEVDWLTDGTSVWTVRQLVFLQLKFAVIVCYLSSHINVVVLVILIFICNVIVYVFWSRIVKSSRKAEVKYTAANFDKDENSNTAHR